MDDYLSLLVMREDDHHLGMMCSIRFRHIGCYYLNIRMLGGCTINIGLIWIIRSPRAMNDLETNQMLNIGVEMTDELSDDHISSCLHKRH